MLNPMREKEEGMKRGEEGKAPVITAFVQNVAEG